MLMVEGKQNRARLGAALVRGGGGAKGAAELRKCGGKGSDCRGEWPEKMHHLHHHQPQQQQREQQPEHQQQQHRIDLRELRAQIVKRVGRERANQYFGHFRSFIAARLRKQELDKLVLQTLGKANIALHNQLVKAVLHNAVRAHSPPPLQQDLSKPLKGGVVVRRKPSSPSTHSDDAFLPWSNGDSFLSSPRKGRSSTARDRRANRDRASPLGPREATSVSDDAASKFEDLRSPDLSRPTQEIEGAAKQLVDAESNSGLVPPVKRLRVLPRIESASVQNYRGIESEQVELKEELLLKEEILLPNGSIEAPLGIPFCPGSVGAARRPPFRAFPGHRLLVDGTEEELVDASDLPDSGTLHRRMEQIATRVERLEGVSGECAHVLNHALDALLNRLIKACVDLVGSKSGRDQERPAMSKDSGLKEGALSGIRLHQGVFSGPAAELLNKDRDKARPPISLADFKVAMDLNPQQLGEDWPVQLEKISLRTFDQ